MRKWRVQKPFNLGGFVANPSDPGGDSRAEVTEEELSQSLQPLAVTIKRLEDLGCIVEITGQEGPAEEVDEALGAPGPPPQRTSTVVTPEGGSPTDDPDAPTTPPASPTDPAAPDATGAPAEEPRGRARGGRADA